MRLSMPFAFALLFVVPAALSAADPKAGGPSVTVEIERSSFNPTIGDRARIVAAFPAAGRATVLVVDRDGYPVRTLAADREVGVRQGFEWDGRDAAGAVVTDEAYSLKIDWRGGGKTAAYFPANQVFPMTSVPVQYYDRRGATLAYELPAPSRIHIQAGTAVKDPKTGVPVGPVMKTVVNREPRDGGRIAEHWNGLDESGFIYVPDLPNFVISVAATRLPEGSIIAFGNASRNFLEVAAARGANARSLFTYTAGAHAHHAGLPSLGDTSPPLALVAEGAVWSESDRAWVVRGAGVRLRLTLGGPAGPPFARQPGKIHRFVNAKLVGTAPAMPQPGTIDIPASRLAPGVNTISVNWQSDYGAVAANSIRVRIDPTASRGAATAKGGSR
jgi:hypothetical protein